MRVDTDSGTANDQGGRLRRCALGIALVWGLTYAPLADVLHAEAPLPPQPGVSGNATGNSGDLGAIDPVLLNKLTKLGDITLKNTALNEAMSSISATWNINIVIGDEIQGQVSGVFQKTPLCEVLNAILLSNGYSYRPVGQTLVVMKLKDIGDNNPLFETTIIPVANSKPEDILNGVKILASPQGKLQVVASSRCLLVTDFPDHVARIRNFAKKLDEAGSDGQGGADGGGRMQVLNFRPQYVEAKFLKDSVTAMLSKEGKTAAMDLDNRVVVYDYPAQLKIILKALQQLDVPRTQVRITAYIYDLNLQDVENIGVNWHNAFKGRYDAAGAAQTSGTIDAVTTAVAAAGSTNGALTFVNMSHNVDLTAVVQLFKSCSNSRLLADPSVSVYDGETAMFSSVTEIPYQQLTQTAQGGNIGTTSFREAGVKLQVIPRIADDGTIKLDCNPIFSRLSGYTPDANPQPIIDRRETKTMVRVNNGQTFVIGGLRTRSDVRNNEGVPGLMQLPCIGWLFRTRATTTTETELIVFIKPEIVNVDYRGLTREQIAAETAKCGVNYVPRAEGCNGCCGQPTLPVGRFGDAIHDPNPPVDPEIIPAGPNGQEPVKAVPVTPSTQTPPAAVPPTPVPPTPALAPPNVTIPGVPEASKPATGPVLRQPDGYVSKPADPSKRYQPPSVAQRAGGTAPPYQPPSAPTPGAAPPVQVAARGAGFEPLPVLDQATPRPGEMTPPRGPVTDVEHTASRPAPTRFESLPVLDGSSGRGVIR